MDLSSCLLFKDLKTDQLNRIASIARELPIEKGQIIFTEGEEATQLFVLRSGAVELTTRAEDDLELPLSILRKQGDCFGTAALVAPYTNGLSARCVQSGALLATGREALLGLIAKDRDLCCTVMTNLAGYLMERLKEMRQELKIHFRTLSRSTRS